MIHQDYDSIRRDVGRQMFGGNKRDVANWSTTDIQDVADVMRDGYERLLVPQIDSPQGVYHWNWQRPVETITLWHTQTGGVTSRVHSGGFTTVTASSGTFYSTMVGRTMTFAGGGGSFVIRSFTSSSVVVLTGDASATTGNWTVTATGDYGFADEVVAVDGSMFFFDATTYGTEIRQETWESVARSRALPTLLTGTPSHFAMIPRAFVGSQGGRYDFSVYPIPDRLFTIRFRPTVYPDVLTAVNKYGLGGPPYARALKDQCLAVFEVNHNGAPGTWAAEALKSLATAIDFDRKAFTPERAPANLDRGNALNQRVTRVSHSPVVVSFP